MRGNHEYLALMLTNLIENGLKYTAGVGRHVHIECHTEECIRIQDDGPGIAEEHWPYLFNRFFQVVPTGVSRESTRAEDPTPSSSGCGLGLALVKWIVQIHGGKVHLQSRVGHGSCFEVQLPIHRVSGTSANKRRASL
ncbi:sensor histidine kinase [Dictyobacter formicarum]|uniref:sensor histidine kinase n=1 Tax=Dictyobacter formicarum TaxID=2778368 RepID=UPI003571356C